VNILLSIHHRLEQDHGAPGVTLQLGSAYREAGHTVSFLSFDDLPSWLPALAKEALYPELATWRLRHAGRAGVDVVDASTGDAWLWARTLRRAGRRPLLVTRSHGLEHRYWAEALLEAREAGATVRGRTRLYHGGLRLREVAASLRASDLCFFMNHDDRDYAVRRLRIPLRRTRVFLNGLPEEFLGLPLHPAGERLRMAHIGSWAERKGRRYLADALARVLDRDPAAQVSLLGTRTPAQAVLSDFPEPVRDRVGVVPDYRHEELPNLLAHHQVAVSASLAEGFSLALPEAMACGLAPVASAISGAREIVREGQNGLLVAPRDAGALADAVQRLAEDPALLERLRRAAHTTAQELSWRRIADESLAAYESGLAELESGGRVASAIT
jgi:glycosyltransferase involved in cell wall biosynthesis